MELEVTFYEYANQRYKNNTVNHEMKQKFWKIISQKYIVANSLKCYTI